METASPPGHATAAPASQDGGCAVSAREALRPEGWPVERIISLLAGGVTLFSLAMGRVHHPRWRLMAGMIGGNLVFQAVAGWCPGSLVIRKLGVTTAAERARQAALRGLPARP